jgi:hypothetical protein
MSLENNKSNFFTERLLPIALCGTLIAIPGCSAKDKIGESSADKNNKQEEAQKPEIKEKNKTSVNNFQEPKIRVKSIQLLFCQHLTIVKSIIQIITKISIKI